MSKDLRVSDLDGHNLNGIAASAEDHRWKKFCQKEEKDLFELSARTKRAQGISLGFSVLELHREPGTLQLLG